MESVEAACTKPPVRPQPRIAAFVGESACEYFVVCEQQVLCKVPTFQTALFITFASYYIFNLEYPTLARNVFCFFSGLYTCTSRLKQKIWNLSWHCLRH